MKKSLLVIIAIGCGDLFAQEDRVLYQNTELQTKLKQEEPQFLAVSLPYVVYGDQWLRLVTIPTTGTVLPSTRLHYAVFQSGTLVTPGETGGVISWARSLHLY